MSRRTAKKLKILINTPFKFFQPPHQIRPGRSRTVPEGGRRTNIRRHATTGTGPDWPGAGTRLGPVPTLAPARVAQSDPLLGRRAKGSRSTCYEKPGDRGGETRGCDPSSRALGQPRPLTGGSREPRGRVSAGGDGLEPADGSPTRAPGRPAAQGRKRPGAPAEWFGKREQATWAAGR
jgi:hypothetical protein